MRNWAMKQDWLDWAEEKSREIKQWKWFRIWLQGNFLLEVARKESMSFYRWSNPLESKYFICYKSFQKIHQRIEIIKTCRRFAVALKTLSPLRRLYSLKVVLDSKKILYTMWFEFRAPIRFTFVEALVTFRRPQCWFKYFPFTNHMSFNIGEGERNYSQFFFKKDIFGTGKCPS